MVMRITKIIQGLRNFARDGDKDPYERAHVLKMLDNVGMLAEFRMKQSNIDFRVVKPEADFTLDCRSIQLEQVLVNTLNNAYDAITEKTEGKWVELKAFKEGENCVFWITDSGNGIPPEVIDKIFNPFFTTKEVGKGTGIGLSISFGIISEHKGSIRVDRQCANTRFVIEIPLKRTKEEVVKEGGNAAA
jgi:C4-dicarboxylate-specific signal transduction histidine kinase